MRIAMIGTGYVGLASGVCISEFGFQVTCVDLEEGKIAARQRLPAAEGADVLVIATEWNEYRGRDLHRIGQLLRGSRAAVASSPAASTASRRSRQFAEERLSDGRQRVVRDGYGPQRRIQTGIGALEVRRPKVRDRAADGESGEKVRFTSHILPKWPPALEEPRCPAAASTISAIVGRRREPAGRAYRRGGRQQIELPRPPGDVERTFADTNMIPRDHGFQPKTPMEEGIPHFVEWLHNSPAAAAADAPPDGLAVGADPRSFRSCPAAWCS